MLPPPPRCTLFPSRRSSDLVAGTADEKLPYAVLNLQTLPLPGVIVYGGGGFHQGALHWLCANTRATDIARLAEWLTVLDRKSTRLNSSHTVISYAVFCLKKK